MHHIYLGYYDIKNEGYDTKAYCSFYPVFEYKNGCFIDIRKNIEEQYAYGNFGVFYEGDSFYNKERFLKHGEYCIIEFFDGDIQEYTNNKGTVKQKIYLETLFKKGQVHPLDEYNIYPIVNSELKNIDFADGNGIITIEESFPIKYGMTKALLDYNGSLYGPFETGFREYDHKVYINTHIKDNNYIITEVDDTDMPDIDPILPSPLRNGCDFYFMCKQTRLIPTDVITDEILREQVLSEGNSSRNSQTLLHNLQDEVLEKRKNRIKQTIRNLENSNYVSNLLYDKALNILSSPDSDVQKQELIETILSHPETVSKLQSSKIVIEKIDEIKKELYVLEQIRDELREKNANLQLENKTKAEEELIKKNEELQLICTEIENKNKELNQIAQKLSLVIDIDKLQEKVKVARNEYDTSIANKLEVERQAEDKVRQAERSFTTAIEKSLDKKLLSSINDILNEEKSLEEDKGYDAIAKHINEKIIFCDKKGSDLINYIVKEVKEYRPDYDHNFIVNILISIQQNFITFFAGPPGTGKTSICNIIANVLGLNNDSLYPDNLTKDIKCTSFTAVSVERGWNTKKDFIGYYNPLSKNIEKNNSDIIDLLKISGKNKENSLLALILLDEANLSPLEYYWSDFVGISDDINNPNRTIDLGNGHKLKVAPPVRFVATMNSDHTVEKLSPRIIDRTAFIILPQPKDGLFKEEVEAKVYAPINWNDLCDALACTNKQLTSSEKDILSGVKMIFKKVNLPITARTEKSIYNYCYVARELFEDKDGIQKEIVAIDYVIAQRILPKISGIGTKYGEALKELLDLCKKNNLYMSQDILSRILANGNESLISNYDYFM